MHSVFDLTACRQPDPSPAELLPAMRRVASLLGCTVRAELAEAFEPHGVTAVLVLAESHLIVTTWPEHALAHIDLFTCRADVRPEVALAPLVALLGGHVAHAQRVPRLFPVPRTPVQPGTGAAPGPDRMA